MSNIRSAVILASATVMSPVATAQCVREKSVSVQGFNRVAVSGFTETHKIIPADRARLKSVVPTRGCDFGTGDFTVKFNAIEDAVAEGYEGVVLNFNPDQPLSPTDVCLYQDDPEKAPVFKYADPKWFVIKPDEDGYRAELQGVDALLDYQQARCTIVDFPKADGAHQKAMEDARAISDELRKRYEAAGITEGIVYHGDDENQDDYTYLQGPN